MLTIALLGASHTETSRLAHDLERSVAVCGWPVAIVVQAGTAALPPAKPGYDLVLLTGLETALAAPPPISPENAQQRARLASSSGASAASRSAVHQAQEVADAAIRAALAEAAMAYRVLYGSPSERLAQAREAIESLLPSVESPAQAHASQATRKPAAWVWLCDKCSDPQCEHRLLSALLVQRAGTT